MQKQDIDKILSTVYELYDLRLQMANLVQDLQENLGKLENAQNQSVNMSYILRDFWETLSNIDLNESFSFISDIEQNANELSYKVRKAEEEIRTAVNPILKNTPVYFDAVNPPDELDYFSKE